MLKQVSLLYDEIDENGWDDSGPEKYRYYFLLLIYSIDIVV